MQKREVGGVVAASIKVTKLQVFDKTLEKVLGFVTVCRLYIRIKMSDSERENLVDLFLCIGGISKCLERKCVKRFERRVIGI